MRIHGGPGVENPERQGAEGGGSGPGGGKSAVSWTSTGRHVVHVTVFERGSYQAWARCSIRAPHDTQCPAYRRFISFIADLSFPPV